MTTVANILRSKTDHRVHTIAPQATVFEAIALMAEMQIGALVVVQDENVIGIFTERDYARKIALMDRSSKSTAVEAVMSAPVMYVRPHQSTDECMRLMTDSRLRHLPVIDEGKLLGLVSIGDLVKSIISEQQFVIEQLEHYITGGRAP
jgi:CBS domain-containing protein